MINLYINDEVYDLLSEKGNRSSWIRSAISEKLIRDEGYLPQEEYNNKKKKLKEGNGVFVKNQIQEPYVKPQEKKQVNPISYIKHHARKIHLKNLNIDEYCDKATMMLLLDRQGISKQQIKNYMDEMKWL
jgi:hypothetical protein